MASGDDHPHTNRHYYSRPETEECKAPVCMTFKTRNYKYIEKSFPAGTTTDELERTGGRDKIIWRYGTCSGGPRCGDCGQYHYHESSLMVAVDGACRGNGTSNAHAAIAVYFGPDNSHNFIGKLDYDPEPTSQKAELAAAIKALEIARKILVEDPDLDQTETITIKTDSAYIVNCMTEYIHKWKQNGWRTSEGAPVKNKKLLKYLDELADTIYLECNVKVYFWHVRREYNTTADRMAGIALDNDLGSPKVFIVALNHDSHSNYMQDHKELMSLLRARAEVTVVKSITNLEALVKGPNTKFLLVDSDLVRSGNRYDMVKFARKVRQRGSRVVLGLRHPMKAPAHDINTFFADIFQASWRISDYAATKLSLKRRNANVSTEGLLNNEEREALVLTNVPKKHVVYRSDSFVYAACAATGQGYVGFVGDLNPGRIVDRAIIALLGLPPVDEERSFRLQAMATKIVEDTEGVRIDRTQVDF